MALLKCAHPKKAKKKLSKSQRVHKMVPVSRFSHAVTSQVASKLNRELKAKREIARKFTTTSDLKFTIDSLEGEQNIY
jgi:hypothetical protein